MEGSGDVVVGARLSSPGSPPQSADGEEDEGRGDPTSDEDVVVAEEVREETLRIMEHTRGLRLDRFADAHDAATRRAAERRRQLANAKKGTAELKRVASAVPLAPRDGTLRHPSTAPLPPAARATTRFTTRR